jgi:dihydropteroate synthase
MISDGATFIDIGAYSSKPSAEFVSEKKNWVELSQQFN